MFEKEFNAININNELNEAVIAQDVNKIKELFSLENPPFVDHEINGVPVIMYAAQRANWDIVEVLYNQEANLDAKVPYLEWHLLHECVKNAPDNVTKAVIDYSNLNCQNKDGKTPLMVAIENNKVSMSNYLVDIGKTDLSIVDKSFQNAAHYAAKNKDYELFTKLVKSGISIEQENKDGLKPFDLIEDPTFKENFSRIISTKEKKSNVENDTFTLGAEEVVVDKPKLSGLSKIKRR